MSVFLWRVLTWHKLMADCIWFITGVWVLSPPCRLFIRTFCRHYQFDPCVSLVCRYCACSLFGCSERWTFFLGPCDNVIITTKCGDRKITGGVSDCDLFCINEKQPSSITSMLDSSARLRLRNIVVVLIKRKCLLQCDSAHTNRSKCKSYKHFACV